MLLLLPLACAPLAVGFIWRMMYHPDFGVITWLVSSLGFNAPNFLGNRSTAMMSIIVFDVWQWTPFITFIVLAGLQSLPKEPFEAAAIDGASPFRVFRTLTLPMISQFLLVAFLLRTIDLVRLYDFDHGGPGTATETLAGICTELALSI
ncbi:MAG: carbohydrate ABC transporter permease [Dethiobacteria bacterium]|jgi:multiple sugar transport system permease protein|nr:sugar ABC transporter permease [Bacillota bacterium]